MHHLLPVANLTGMEGFGGVFREQCQINTKN